MSHFAVAVFIDPMFDTIDQVEERLAMYSESDETYCTEVEIDEDGDEWRFNPNAKWDWWDIGGRWCDTIPLKNGKYATYASIADINFGIDKNKYDNLIKEWDAVVENKGVDENKKPYYFYNPEYYTSRYASKEEFAEKESKWFPFAFVDPDGKWHEKGEMGWFGINDATRNSISVYEKEFKECSDICKKLGYAVVIVDCHI